MITPANRAWLETIIEVLEHGHDLRQEDCAPGFYRENAPRDATTREALCHTIRVPMSEPLVTLTTRHLGYRFACAETACVLSGDNRVATIAPYAKLITSCSDDGYTFNGHYGCKFIEQVSWVAATLVKNETSRKAVMNIWRERPGDTKDCPKLLSLQWLIRDGLLHCVSTISSSDVWLELPYDMHMFSAMSAHLALVLKKYHCVDVDLGWLHNTAGSRHLYLRDQEAAIVCLDPLMSSVKFEYTPLDLDDFNQPDDLVDHYWRLARGELLHASWMVEAFAAEDHRLSPLATA